MTRTRAALTAVGLILVLGLLGLWLLAGPGSAPAPPTQALDPLLEQFQLVALAGRAAPGFTLETLDGGHFALADLGGRPALLYFWASW